jgi:L-arabinonolactonase
MLRIELLIDAHAELGEGPLWDVAEQRLFWIDSLGARVHSCDARGGAPRSWDVPEHIGSLALRQTGGAIVSLRDGFYALDFASGSCRKLVDPDPGKPRIRMNDGKVDRQGRFVAGYMDYEERDPICGLFRLDPGGSVSKIDDGIVCSNGPCWSPDGRSFYFADTYTRDIWAYDYDTETGGRPTAASSAPFPPRASRGCRTARPSTRKASSGACRSMRASSPASRPTASSTASSDFLSKTRPA